MRRDLPPLAGALARLLIRGEGAEFVLGDLQERFAEELEEGASVAGARGRCLLRVLASAIAWWAPSAIRSRRRATVGGAGGSAGARRSWTESGWVGEWTADATIALRSMVRRPTFSLGVVATLALGIGATTTVFSVVDGLLLRPLPFPEASRLALVGATFPGREWADEEARLQHLAGISMLNFRDYAARTRSFEGLSGVELTNVLLPDVGSGPELASATRVGSDFFGLFGAEPAAGRTFEPGDHATDAPQVVVLSHGAWVRRFGADPAAIGRPLETMGTPTTVVGVLSPDFQPPEAIFGVSPDFWLPLQPSHPRYASRGMRSLYVAGRLRTGTDVGAAREEAEEIARSLAEDFPEGNVYPDGTHFGIGINGLRAETVGVARVPLKIFLGAALMLLALAALNAATLLLARSLDRVRELDVRRALGAGGARIARLLLTEAALLSLVAGGVGVLMALGGIEAFRRFAPDFVPRVEEVTLDLRILAVALVVSLGAGLGAGVIPALRAARGEVALANGTRGATVEPASRLRSMLVGAQVAVAVVLLSGAALLSASFLEITSLDAGFDPEGLVSMRVDLKRPDAPLDEEAWQGWERILEEVAAVPGAVAVAGTTNPPFQSPFWAPRVLLPGDADDVWREGVAGYAITPGYLETVGATLVDGRDLLTSDGPDGAKVALVNEAFVRELLRDEAAVGTTLRMGEEDGLFEVQIVGVVGDMVQARAQDGYRPALYVPYTQSDWPMVQVVVRTPLPPEVVVPRLRSAAARFSPYVPPRDLRMLEDRMASTRTTPRFQTALAGAFAAVALLLAALGLYGSLAHAVGRRRRELGVRMALGAETRGLFALVLAQGMRVALGGLLLGLVVTFGVGGVLGSYLYFVEPRDIMPLLGASTVLLLVSAVACVVPARRAMAVDPTGALTGD